MAKPVVDRIEEDLEGRAEVLRIPVISEVGTALAREYGVRGVPTLLVFDGAGQVIYAQAGTPDREAVVAAVAGALGQ